MATAPASGSERWLRPAAALLGFALLVTTGVADGGVLPRVWRLSTLALAATAAAALLARDRIALTRLEGAVVATLAAYAGWVALSALWSGAPGVSVLQAERSLAYAVLALAALVLTDRAGVPWLLAGTLAGIAAVSAYSLGEYLFARAPLDPFEGDLLHRPLGYANALGIYAAIGILLTGGLALWSRRVLVLAPLAVLLPTLALTSSRGAWLALAAGTAVLVLLARPSAAVVAAAGALAVLSLAAILVVSGGPGSLGRLAGENRADYWRVAWEQYRDDPLLGGGAGTFGEHYLRRGTAGFTRTAHSLYVQSLAELGPVGLALVVCALALPFARLRGARGDPLVAAATAPYAAYVLHTGVDWDWELPATTFAGLLCGAALLAATRGEAPALGVRTRAALVAVLLAVAAVALFRIATGPTTPFGP